jgi:hypothetical protein
MSFKIPILFQIFNRIDTSLKVFQEIKKIKPQNLYIVQDGARKDKLSEEDDCLYVRSKILEQVDWECNLKTYFRTENMGPGAGTADALKWFFNQVEYGIVLEHDCLPHPDFFEYCAALLKKYKNEDKVKLINGSNFQNGKTFGKESYYFGVSAQIWGWAAWKRTLVNYEYNIDKYDQETVYQDIRSTFKTHLERKYWQGIYHLTKNRIVDTWDYQLLFTIWHQKGLIAIPNINLVSNIGFGSQSVHCSDENSFLAYAKTFPILPLKYVCKIKRNYISDKNYLHNYLISNPNIASSLKARILRNTPDFIYKSYKFINRRFITNIKQ